MDKHYNDTVLNQHIQRHILGLIPSKVPKYIKEIVPNEIWETMSDDIKKDVDELYTVYYHEQWTATSLMACRLLENTLAIHIEEDLKEKEPKNIGGSIKILEQRNYPKSLTDKLDEYREKRNDLMHGIKRASAAEAKELVGYSMSLCVQIHNIKP